MFYDTNKQAMCLYNVTSQRVRVSILAVEKQYHIFRVCVCSLICVACNAHALYYVVICGLSDSTIFILII